MEKRFDDTTIPEIVSNELAANTSFTLGAMHIGKFCKVLMTGASALIGTFKSVEKPKALSFKKLNGDFIAGAKIEYFKNPDDPDNAASGNWSYTWTFNEDDLSDADVVDIDSSTQVLNPFNAAASKLYRMRFNDNAGEVFAFNLLLETISSWLDENAKEGETVELITESFTAKAVVKDGIVQKSIEPGADFKVMVKGDSEYQDQVEE